MILIYESMQNLTTIGDVSFPKGNVVLLWQYGSAVE